MIRRGINRKNFEYWLYEVYLKWYKYPDYIAELKAHRICHEQEIKMLKDRIIKLEKRLKK